MPAYDLKAEIWISALIRRAEGQGAYATIMHKGDKDSGTAIVKSRQMDGQTRLFTPMRGVDGDRFWMLHGPETESAIDKRIKDHIRNDPDVWVVEIEDRDGRHFLTEKVTDDLYG